MNDGGLNDCNTIPYIYYCLNSVVYGIYCQYKYVQIAFLVIYLGFWFSFKSSDSPAIESLDVNTLYLIGMIALPVIVLVMAICIFYSKK